MIELQIIENEIKSLENNLKQLKETEKHRELYKEEQEFFLKVKGALIELYTINDEIKEAYKNYLNK